MNFFGKISLIFMEKEVQKLKWTVENHDDKKVRAE
jgi:hypothetical protein